MHALTQREQFYYQITLNKTFSDEMSYQLVIWIRSTRLISWQCVRFWFACDQIVFIDGHQLVELKNCQGRNSNKSMAWLRINSFEFILFCCCFSTTSIWMSVTNGWLTWFILWNQLLLHWVMIVNPSEASNPSLS